MNVAPAVALLASALLIAACSEADDANLHGYAEGDFRLLSPAASGRIETLEVMDGAAVARGDLIGRLETAVEREDLRAAGARAEAARARLAEAAAGGRPQEVAAARDQLARARAEQRRDAEDLARIRALFERQVVPRARLDEAVAAAEQARAQVAELLERSELVALPAREQRLAALAADVEAAEAEVARLRLLLERHAVRAPANGVIERVLARPGESGGPTRPLVRFLPDSGVLAVLYVPEPRLAATPVGTRLGVACDACPPGLTAVVTVVDPEAEFTPPVIYSSEERARLVYRAEARFEGPPPPPGTPLRFRVLGDAS